MKRRAVIERAIGETRAAIYEGRKLVELHLDRRTQRGGPKIGERWTAQVTAIDPAMGGVWAELGEGPAGLLSFKGQKDLPRLTEGQSVDVTIAKEAIVEKGPVLRYAGEPTQSKPSAVERLTLQQRLKKRFPDIAFEEAPVGIVDTATERTVAVPGGGRITLERTQAMIAVDVDKGEARTVMDCSVNAAKLILDQLRLRQLGGLIAIDFPNLRQPKQRNTIIRIMEERADADPASIRVAPFSRFGVVEMTRGQDGPSIDSILNDPFGRPTLETRGLRTLRRLEREAKAHPGAKLTLAVTHDILAWLNTPPFDWQSAMAERIGARFSVEAGNIVDVRSDR